MTTTCDFRGNEYSLGADLGRPCDESGCERNAVRLNCNAEGDSNRTHHHGGIHCDGPGMFFCEEHGRQHLGRNRAKVYEQVKGKLVPLDDLVGQTVSVCISAVPMRAVFCTQISVHGTLEVHPVDPNSFRVLVTKGTYAYFKRHEAKPVGVEGNEFADGSVAAIYLVLD